MSVTREMLDPIGVMPVIVLNDANDAVPVTNALKAGGIKAVEVTLRTDAALESLRRIKAECEDVLVGVGTIVEPSQIDAVAEIGVDFAVSPGMTERLVKHAQDKGVSLLPGVATPSEVMQGMELGLSCFKLFPAVAVGGIPLLKSIGGPLPQVSFCPTGGLKIDTFTDFLALPNVGCVGGTWLVPNDAVEAKAWDKITEIAHRTTEKIIGS